MGRSRSLTWMILAVVSALVVPPSPVRAAEPFCGDVQFIWARGTGQGPGDPDNFAEVRNLLDDRLGASVSYTTYELGQDQGFGGYDYPADGGGFGVFQ